MSHFATFPPIPPTNDAEDEVNCAPHRRFLGTTREVNHKTSTQRENWIGLFADVASIYNESPEGSKFPLNPAEIGRKATGYSGDHAPDQMKLSKELHDHKMSCDHLIRGEEAIISTPEDEIRKVVDEKFGRILEEVGDWEGWETRSREEQQELLNRLINEVYIHFGKVAFEDLPEPLQRSGGLWFWSGCCMHKELNTFKGGAVRMSAFWKEAGLKGPVPLLSREQEEAASADTTDKELRNLSGGAAKLADLVGALVRNKVETKGFPEEFRAFSKDQLTYEISFPDTSNTRYQCYGDAATELIQHPGFYIDFLNLHGKKKKRAAGLNHMEKNIVAALDDPPTQTELAVFSLYSEAISKPYAITVRGSINESKNALDLGPIHLQIITHIDGLIENPSLLIGDNVSHETGALYGTRWDQDIVDHILFIRDSLPHLQPALIAFLQGAREKWVVFTKEYKKGSEVANSTAEERRLSFRSPTNDHSEGAGATWKQLSRHAPSMTTHQKNARLFLQLNSTDIETFQDFSEPDRAFVRKKAREIDAAKSPEKERKAQAVADREAAEEEQREAERLQKGREERDAREADMIKDFQPILNCNEFLALPNDEPTRYFLRCQLIWLRRIGGDKELPSGIFSSTNKATMKKLVIEALRRRDQDGMDIGAVYSRLEDMDIEEVDSGLEDMDVEEVDSGSEDLDVEAVDSGSEDAELSSGTESNTTSTVEGTVTVRDSVEAPNCSPGLGRNPPPGFGCKWDSVNYSCAYDCVYTVLAWVYFHATHTWREKWTRESLMASFLSDHFEKILSSPSEPTSNLTMSRLFTEGRDAWRDVLYHHNPVDFPRRGSKFASLARLLEILAKDQHPSHYATVFLSCNTPGCPPRVKNIRAKYYMLTRNNWNAVTRTTTPPHHESLEAWIKNHYSSPRLTKTRDRCTHCQKRFARELVFSGPTWTWFDVVRDCRHAVIPTLKLSLGSVSLRLAAIIYSNIDHYRARISDPSGVWWFYDGRCNGGQLERLPKLTNETELFKCGDGYDIAALVYCLVDW